MFFRACQSANSHLSKYKKRPYFAKKADFLVHFFEIICYFCFCDSGSFDTKKYIRNTLANTFLVL